MQSNSLVDVAEEPRVRTTIIDNIVTGAKNLKTPPLWRIEIIFPLRGVRPLIWFAAANWFVGYINRGEMPDVSARIWAEEDTIRPILPSTSNKKQPRIQFRESQARKLSHREVRCRLARHHRLHKPPTKHTFHNHTLEIKKRITNIQPTRNQWIYYNNESVNENAAIKSQLHEQNRCEMRSSPPSKWAGLMCHRAGLHLNGPSRQHRRHKQGQRVRRRGRNLTAETEQHPHLQSCGFDRILRRARKLVLRISEGNEPTTVDGTDQGGR
jgi:hypothetical protein